MKLSELQVLIKKNAVKDGRTDEDDTASEEPLINNSQNISLEEAGADNVAQGKVYR